MVRTLSTCAVLFIATLAAAQNAAAPNDTVETPQSTTVAPIPTVSACNKGGCPASDCNGDSSACDCESGCDSSACDSKCKKRVAANQALLERKLAELTRLQTEIEELRRTTGTPQQVLINVRVLEISRTKMRRLGMDFASVDVEKNTVTTKQIDSIKDARDTFGMRIIDNSDALTGFIDMLQQNNIARILADPSIMTICGQPASFHVGGEQPLPALPGSNQAVEFQKYGTQVDVLAVALGDNRVRLDLRLKVSELDNAHSVMIGDTQVPAIRMRQCASPIDLEFGQTGILSGLAERRVEQEKTDAGVATNENEVELLFMVTAESVSAITSRTRNTR